MKFQKLYPLFTLAFFMATCVLLYLQYFSVPEISQIPKTTEIELQVVAQSTETPTEEPKITDEEIQRLMDVENEQKELILLFERVSADLNDASRSKKVLAQLMLGRSTLRDFGKRFYNYKLFRKSGGFLRYIRQKTKTYLSDGELGVNPTGIKQRDLAKFRKEITSWLMLRTNEEIEAVARFLSFFFAETLYDIPMTMLASRMTPELEEIDFSTPVLLENVLTTPSRDADGEMNEKKPTNVTKYSMAQQFFFRRGPKIAERAAVFLKAYLSYTDL